MAWITSVKNRFKSFKRITTELQNSDAKIVLVGNGRDAMRFHRFFADNARYWGMARFDENGVGKPYSDLILEDIENFVVILCDDDLVRCYEEKLVEIGFNTSQFQRHCITGISSRLNYYDDLVGYTKISKNGLPGYVFFPPTEEVEAKSGYFTILTLGGSTTDPGTGNVISWSECLYNDIRKYCDNVRVVCAGVNSHVASQELFKLIRDGYLFSPDLVISYSGVNDFSDHYQDTKNPFVLCYTKRIMPVIAKKNILNEKDVMYSDRIHFWDIFYGRIVKSFSFGVNAPKPVSRTEHWIRCEKMMKAVSQTMNADFIGFLQPQNFEDDTDSKVKMRNLNYDEAKKKLSKMNSDWLIDFTDIFEGQKNVFYDNCHVYGRGNRIIAKRMLPYVLKVMKNRQIIK